MHILTQDGTCSVQCLKFRVAEEGRRWEEQGREMGGMSMEEMPAEGFLQDRTLYPGRVGAVTQAEGAA